MAASCATLIYFSETHGNSYKQEECEKVDKAVYHMAYVETVTDTLHLRNIHKPIELRQQQVVKSFLCCYTSYSISCINWQ